MTTIRSTAYGDAFKGATSRRSKKYHSEQRHFDEKECMFRQNNAFSLGLTYEHGGGYAAGLDSTHMNYDFLNRVLIVEKRAPNVVSHTVTPFAELDTEVLTAMHGKLIELGGNPPPLPTASATRITLSRKAS